MKKIILSILCLSSFIHADNIIDSNALAQEIDAVLQLLSEDDNALFALGQELSNIIDDRMLEDGSEEILNSLSHKELIMLFGSVSKKKCSKCCSSCCSSCKKCKKCCCKVQSLLSEEA